MYARPLKKMWKKHAVGWEDLLRNPNPVGREGEYEDDGVEEVVVDMGRIISDRTLLVV